MNSIMERWVQTCRRELLDRILIWNQRHLLHALHEFEQFCNEHSPHQGMPRDLHGWVFRQAQDHRALSQPACRRRAYA
jgi:putative transposase